MFVPGVGIDNNQVNNNCFKNTRLQLSFLGVGALLVTLGITLMCYSQGNLALSTLGNIIVTIGTPCLLYGVIGLIYNKCSNSGTKSKKNNIEQNGTSKPKQKCFSGGQRLGGTESSSKLVQG